MNNINVTITQNSPINITLTNESLGDMKKSTYDTNNNGIVDKAEAVDDGAGNSATASNIRTTINRVDQDLKTTASPTFNNLTINNLTINGQAYSPIYTLTDGEPVSVDWNNANVQSITLGGNRTLNFSNPQSGALYILIINQDATGSRTVTWDSTVKFPGGVLPMLSSTANAKDIFTFVSDGTNYYNIGFAPDVR